jgi:tol-pal system beta propeller repeat protein TolB
LTTPLLVYGQQEVQPEVFLSGKVAISDRISLHFTGIKAGNGAFADVLDTLNRVLVRDLTLSGLFNLRLPNLPPDSSRSLSAPTITYLEGDLSGGSDCQATFRLKAGVKAAPFWKNGYGFSAIKARAAAHRIAADLIRQLTGEPSVTQTRLGFTGKTKGGKDLFSTTFDGFDLKRYTTLSVALMSPSWSPDGTRLAFTGFQKGNADIYVLNLASGQVRTFQASPGVDSAPEWSPDGNSLAYSSSEEGNAEIYVRSVNGGPAKRLTFDAAIETSPSWAPTGREIAFTSDRLGKPQVFVMDAEGGNVRRLTPFGDYNDSPCWSPRGDMIAYVRRGENDGFQVFVTDTRGERHVKLTTGPGDNMSPTWSPDGMKIAFASNRTGIYQIYTMDLYGRNQERVTESGMECTSPTWSPALSDSVDIVITTKK